MTLITHEIVMMPDVSFLGFYIKTSFESFFYTHVRVDILRCRLPIADL